MILLDSIEITKEEAEALLQWSAIFFENGVRLMTIANFIHEKMVHKEKLVVFLQEKVRTTMHHYEGDAFFEHEKKCIGESAHRMILSMLEMIKIEGDVHEDIET